MMGCLGGCWRSPLRWSEGFTAASGSSATAPQLPLRRQEVAAAPTDQIVPGGGVSDAARAMPVALTRGAPGDGMQDTGVQAARRSSLRGDGKPGCQICRWLRGFAGLGGWGRLGEADQSHINRFIDAVQRKPT